MSADASPTDPDERLLSELLYRFADAETVAQVQRRYVQFFTDIRARTVLDVGSGRGIFLRLLAEVHIDGHGVDSNRAAIEACQRDGIARVAHGDALDYLEACRAQGQQFDGVFCSHVVEHMPGPTALRMLRLAADLLAPGGRLVVVTPNPANLRTLTHVFWMDPTHVRPYPRELVAAMMTALGLKVVTSFDDALTRRSIGRWRGLARLPIDVLRLGISPFSGGDSVVVGERS